MSETVLRLDKVDKSFGDFKAVDQLSASIIRGKIYGFLGPNGAGKTTTVRMMLDIFKPDRGEIRVLGQSSAMLVRDRIGYLPEEKGLYKKMKLWAVIQYFAMLKGLPAREAKGRALYLLEKYGLGEFANAKVESLSKGMAQKVQLLCTVAHTPELVILDEPFGGLDPVNQAALESMIEELASEGRTVIFSTHVMQHAERLCDQILLVAGGRKIFDGTVSEAKATIPGSVVLQTDSDVSVLDSVTGVTSIESVECANDGAMQSWRLHISDRLDPQDVLGACFDRGIRLKRFEVNDPTLHDVFLHLVGNGNQATRTDQAA